MSEFEKYRNQKSAYKVPEAYFRDQRQELLQIAENHPDIGVKGFRMSAGWIAIGTAAALLLGLFVLGSRQTEILITTDDFTREEISEFVQTGYHYELTEEILLLELDKDDLSSLKTELFTPEELEMTIDNNYDQTLHYEYL